MLKFDKKTVDLLNDLIETSELSKKHNTPLANIILKLSEEVGELAQAYLKYSGSVNASKSG
jgi:NTP pyrophosphatase (non-canonical NTP hydrolase)